jgi:hypothetical protein
MELGMGLPVAGKFASTEAIEKIARRADELDYAAAIGQTFCDPRSIE